MSDVVYLGAVEGYESARQVAGDKANVRLVAADPGEVTEALKTASAVLDASMRVKITDQMIAVAPNLRIISTATTGSDHIERNEIERRGISVRTLKEDKELLRNITPAAELSWALVMALARKLPWANAHVMDGKWVREEFPGMMLNGRTLGVVGCGRIGQWMARYAQAFGMSVVGYDPVIDPWPDNIRKASLVQVAAAADILTVHVHLSGVTRGLISADIFSHMKQGAIFINTSRGALADEAALLAALQSGHLAGAGLDVLEGEPEINNHPLVEYARNHRNVIITPHCGGFSPDAVRVVCGHAMKKILAELNGAS